MDADFVFKVMMMLSGQTQDELQEQFNEGYMAARTSTPPAPVLVPTAAWSTQHFRPGIQSSTIHIYVWVDTTEFLAA